jgi:hypothetical protein
MFSVGLEKDFIFVHVPKTGGTSIKMFLLENIEHSKEKRTYQLEGKYKYEINNKIHVCNGYHAPLALYFDASVNSLANNITRKNTYKFTVYRNIYDKVLSLYFWKFRMCEKLIDFNIWIENELNEVIRLKNCVRDKKTFVNDMEWTGFLGDHATKFGHLGRLELTDIIKYTEMFDPKEMDKIINYENIQTEFEMVCAKLKINKGILPHAHKTQHLGYRKYFNENSIKTVYNCFKEDIEYFNCEF